LIATARENWKLLFEMLNLRFVAMASEETSTPTLLFENVAPDTFARAPSPDRPAPIAAAVIVAGALAGSGCP